MAHGIIHFGGGNQPTTHRQNGFTLVRDAGASCRWAHMGTSIVVQANAVITRSSKTLYCIQHCRDWTELNQRLNSQMTPHTSPLRARYGVFFCEDLGENWPRYNGTALYMDMTCSRHSQFWWKNFHLSCLHRHSNCRFLFHLELNLTLSITFIQFFARLNHFLSIGVSILV